MPTPRSYVGFLLKHYRGRSGLTQEQLASRAGLSVTGISKIERGIHPSPHCDTIYLLADALGLSPDDRAALEQAACQSAILSPWLRDDQTVSLGAVLQAITSLAGRPGDDHLPPTAHSA